MAVGRISTRRRLTIRSPTSHPRMGPIRGIASNRETPLKPLIVPYLRGGRSDPPPFFSSNLRNSPREASVEEPAGAASCYNGAEAKRRSCGGHSPVAHVAGATLEGVSGIAIGIALSSGGAPCWLVQATLSTPSMPPGTISPGPRILLPP